MPEHRDDSESRQNLSLYYESDNESRRTDIIAANLRETAERLGRLERLRLLEGYELLSTLSGKMGQLGSPQNVIAAASMLFSSPELDGLFSLSDKVAICRRLVDMMRDSGLDPLELLFQQESEEPLRKVGYVDNPVTAAAGEILAPGCETVIYHSFTEVCEDTAAGDCDACILPIENTADGKLLNFYSLIDRFDLKICMHCDIYSDNDNHRTRYALLRRGIYPPDDSAELFLELGISGHPPEQLLSAAGLCSLNVHRVDSLPLHYSESDFTFTPVFKGQMCDILVFVVFLAFNHIQYSITGLSSQRE